MIQTTITGNVGRDAKIVENQNPFCAFTIAVDDSYVNKDGVKIDRAIWVECILNDVKKGIIPYIKKGTKMLVQGKPVAGIYTDKDGKAQPKLTIAVMYCELIGKAPETKPEPETVAPVINENTTDDLPF